MDNNINLMQEKGIEVPIIINSKNELVISDNKLERKISNNLKRNKTLKKKLIKLLEVCYPNIHKALKEIELERGVYDAWIGADLEFAGKVEDIKNSKLDALEEHIFVSAMNSKYPTLALPILRAKRGEVWGDNVNINHKVMKIVVNAPFVKPESKVNEIKKK